MKIIFLDIDGVLNTYSWLEGLKGKRPKNMDEPEGRSCEIDPSLVAQLNRIIEATGAKVVVSSSWRIGRTIDFLQRTLVAAGFTGEVIGKTRSSRGRTEGGLYMGECRGKEIGDWIETAVEQHGMTIGEFVILDDDEDMGDLLPFLIRTSLETGLTSEHADKAISLLNGGGYIIDFKREVL